MSVFRLSPGEEKEVDRSVTGKVVIPNILFFDPSILNIPVN